MEELGGRFQEESITENTIAVGNQHNARSDVTASSYKNILLIGRAGSGKSTLIDVLKDNKGYQIIDTVGIGNTKLTEEEIVHEIAKTCHKFKSGLTQILFVIGGRITLEEIEIYNIIKERLFDDDITKNTTIVRTKFPYFQDSEECDKDREDLKKQKNKNISNLINSCNKVIYVDNPSIDTDYFDEEEIAVYKKIREVSRNELLKHLATYQSIYKPNNLELINRVLEKYASGNEQLDKESKKILRGQKIRMRKAELI